MKPKRRGLSKTINNPDPGATDFSNRGPVIWLRGDGVVESKANINRRLTMALSFAAAGVMLGLIVVGSVLLFVLWSEQPIQAEEMPEVASSERKTQETIVSPSAVANVVASESQIGQPLLDYHGISKARYEVKVSVKSTRREELIRMGIEGLQEMINYRPMEGSYFFELSVQDRVEACEPWVISRLPCADGETAIRLSYQRLAPDDVARPCGEIQEYSEATLRSHRGEILVSRFGEFIDLRVLSIIFGVAELAAMQHEGTALMNPLPRIASQEWAVFAGRNTVAAPDGIKNFRNQPNDPSKVQMPGLDDFKGIDRVLYRLKSETDSEMVIESFRVTETLARGKFVITGSSLITIDKKLGVIGRILFEGTRDDFQGKQPTLLVPVRVEIQLVDHIPSS